jgi:hypothetical protein
MTGAIDFSDADEHDRLQREPFNVEINAAIERATTAVSQDARGYLGASSAGGECMRRIQFDWMCAPATDARKALIFGRGHAAEAMVRAQLQRAGFVFAPAEALAFVAFDYFAGHADGVIVRAPALPGIYLPVPAVWECKCVNAKNFRAIARDGLAHAFPQYATQIALYQHFLGKLNPAFYSVVNANTCEVVHFPVSYDSDRAEKAIERIKQVIEATRAGMLLERAYDDPSDWRCVRGCSHASRCWKSP